MTQDLGPLSLPARATRGTGVRTALTAVLAAGLSVLLAPLGAPASAAQDPPPTPPGLPLHVALGDSVAAGVGATPGEGYVDLLVARLRTELDCLPAGATAAADGCRRLGVENLAVPGHRTTELMAVQLPAATALMARRNGNANPRDDVETVSVTIGGNDVFGPVIAACVVAPGPACQPTVLAAVSSVRVNLGVILGRLRAAAGPDAEIAVMTYYNPLLPPCRFSAAYPLGEQVLEGGGGLPVGLNDVIREAAEGVGGSVADTYAGLGADDLVGDCLHPDGSGHARIAEAFVPALTG